MSSLGLTRHIRYLLSLEKILILLLLLASSEHYTVIVVLQHTGLVLAVAGHLLFLRKKLKAEIGDDRSECPVVGLDTVLAPDI